jgi:sugar phosphate isomerase/epimerase
MNSEPDSDRKVIGLFDKKPFVREALESPEETFNPAPLSSEPEIDEEAVEALEDALEQAKRGGVRGVVVLMGLATITGDDVVTDVSMISTSAVTDHIQIFVGGLETAKVDLIKTHEDMYWGDDDVLED